MRDQYSRSEDSAEDLRKWALEADVIFHLAGVNRPQDPIEFEKGNAGLSEQCAGFCGRRMSPRIVFSSSIQAEVDNPYGTSKAKAENTLRQFAAETGACVIYIA